MKGHINVLPVMLVFFLVAIAGVSLFVYVTTDNVATEANAIEQASFLRTLSHHIEAVKKTPYGSSREVALSLPKGVSRVCFVDEALPYNQYFYPTLEVQKSIQPDKNVFLQAGTFVGEHLSGFTLSTNPECFESEGNLRLTLTSKGNRTHISAAQAYVEASCIPLATHGDPKDKVDVLFIGHGYEDKMKLYNDAVGYIEHVFRQVEPLASNIEKFNFYYLPKQFEQCQITSFIKCDHFLMQQHAAQCPHDYLFLLADRSKIANIANPVRSSALQHIAKINTANERLELAHELGHSFGKLGEEYVDDEYYAQFDVGVDDFPNCAVQGCPEWSALTGVSCIPGCTKSSYYRATENSLMNIYWNPGGDVFGPVNSQLLLDKLEAYS